MKIEIDQSGEIADTKLPTALAFSNGKSSTLFISAVMKRKIIQELRRSHNATVLYFRLFAVLIFILIRNHMKAIQSIYIDQEYIGRGDEIKAYLLELLYKSKIKIDVDSIHFTHIGKKSKAHIYALKSLQSKDADKIITFEDVMKYF